MAINTISKALKLNNISINENVSKWIEQDIIVPDTKPDAIKIVNVTVTPYVNNIESMQDKIKVSGNINYFIIYKVDDQVFGTRGLFTSYPYSEIIEVKGATEEMIVNIKPVCKNVIFSLPNERKISVKSEIIFKTRLKKIENVDLINRFEVDNKIECKMCKNSFCNIMQDKKSIIASKEEFMLPKEAEDFYELLNVDAKIINTEYKESYNKVMIKGDIDIKMIYLAENQSENVKKVNYTLPFSAMVELENINDNSKFEINYIMQEFNLKLNPEITSTKTMTAEYQIEVNVVMFEEEEVEYIEDFYSQSRELNFDLLNVKGVRKTVNLNKNIELKESIANALLENSKLIDYRLDTSYIVPVVLQNNIKLEGEAKVTLLIQDLNNLELDSKTLDIIVNESYDLDNIANKNNIFVDISQERINITQSGQDLDIRIQLEVNTRVEEVKDINVISNIIDDDLDLTGLDSINIYIVKPGDTLWNIAKKYKTSVDKIVKTNDIIDPDAISVGQKILVIR